MIVPRHPSILILALALFGSCSKNSPESVHRSLAKVQDSASAHRPPESVARIELTVDGVGVAPGIWVDSAMFAKHDVTDPTVLNEAVGENGVRIRWWQHLGKGFQWVSTNQGMDSPDGPYWISQVSSSQKGACFGIKFCVGQVLSQTPSDTEFTQVNEAQELTVTVEAGRIKSLMLSTNTHPR